jgi:hypothetical protein
MDKNMGFLVTEKTPVVIRSPGDTVSIPTRHEELKDIRARQNTIRPTNMTVAPANCMI